MIVVAIAAAALFAGILIGRAMVHADRAHRVSQIRRYGYDGGGYPAPAKRYRGYGFPPGGHRGTSAPAPEIPMTDRPCSAVQPPTPRSTQVILREGPPA